MSHFIPKQLNAVLFDSITRILYDWKNINGENILTEIN